MGLFGKSKEPESASSVRKYYDYEIIKFLRNAKGERRSLLGQREEPLTEFLGWGNDMLGERKRLKDELDREAKSYRHLKEQLDFQTRAMAELQNNLNELKNEHFIAKSHLQEASGQLLRLKDGHGRDIAELTSEHTRSMNDCTKKHDLELQRMKSASENRLETELRQCSSKWENRLKTAEASFDTALKEGGERLRSLRATHEKNIQSMLEDQDAANAAHGTEIGKLRVAHSKEVDKLVGQLLVNQRGNQGWPDDKLKRNFQELQRLIETVSSSRMFIVPKGQQLGSHLDPSNFLGRVSRGKGYVLLRSTIWSIIHERFFSAPFGFGAFGPGEGQKRLLEVYKVWERVVGSTNGSVEGKFSVLHHSKSANNWRAATFQCIGEALDTNDEEPFSNESPLKRLGTVNENETIGKILVILSEVSRMSNNTVEEETKTDVRQIVTLGRDLALQFGVHPAQLGLLVPSPGQQVRIGEEYHDCQDGDSSKGTVYTVDLVPLPGLQKRGDGRLDIVSVRTIVPCQIYPLEEE